MNKTSLRTSEEKRGKGTQRGTDSISGTDRGRQAREEGQGQSGEEQGTAEAREEGLVGHATEKQHGTKIVYSVWLLRHLFFFF